MTNFYEIFEGRWALSRFAKDDNGTILSTMVGEALFIRSAGAILYEEVVNNYYEDHLFSASKNYLYQVTSDSLEIWLLDKRLFASFKKEHITNTPSSFFCGNDCYQTTFSSLNHNEIIQTVQVSGKKKQFYIQTTLSKK